MIYSCDTREDFNINLNKAPELEVRRDDNLFNPVYSYQSTINDSFKLSEGNYYFDYRLLDDESAGTIKIIISITGEGDFINNASVIETRYIFNPQTTGFKNIILKVIDSYGLEANANINLTVFKNLLPVGILSYQKTAVLDSLEYRIKADQSYDKDAKFGGKILFYEYSISPTYQVKTPSNYINYIFPVAGNYQVSLRVQDNDSIWSPSTVIYINVN